MKQELSQQLKNLAPHLYQDMWGDPTRTCLCYGIETPDSWFEDLKQVSLALEELILTFPAEQRADYRAVQVKSKFGGLRFYLNDATPDMTRMIREVEDKYLCLG